MFCVMNVVYYYITNRGYNLVLCEFAKLVKKETWFILIIGFIHFLCSEINFV